MVCDEFYWNGGGLCFEKEGLLFGSEKGLSEIDGMIESEDEGKFGLGFRDWKVFGEEVFGE